MRRAMEALPNDFPDRDTYISVGQALKGALPGDPELEFSSSKPGPPNGPTTTPTPQPRTGAGASLATLLGQAIFLAWLSDTEAVLSTQRRLGLRRRRPARRS